MQVEGSEAGVFEASAAVGSCAPEALPVEYNGALKALSRSKGEDRDNCRKTALFMCQAL